MSITKVLGIIMARGGSKGLPGKNVLPLAGKPLIAYTIEAAQKAQLMDRVIVSTDDSEIAGVSRQYGAEVPFMRPPELAQDDSLAIPVLKHATLWLEEHQEYRADYVLLLQPTSPLRTPEDIDNSIRLALEKDADAVVGYAPVQQHPAWMKTISADGKLAELLPPDPAHSRRQNLPPVYHVSGSIYLVKRHLILDGDTFYTDKTYAYVVPRERAIDIDTAFDLRVAELLLEQQCTQMQAG